MTHIYLFIVLGKKIDIVVTVLICKLARDNNLAMKIDHSHKLNAARLFRSYYEFLASNFSSVTKVKTPYKRYLQIWENGSNKELFGRKNIKVDIFESHCC